MSYVTDSIPVTEEERQNKFRGATPYSVQWVQWDKHVKAASDDLLRAIFTNFWAPNGRFNYEHPPFKEYVADFRPGNLTTLMFRIGEEAYMRDILDEDDWIRLQETDG